MATTIKTNNRPRHIVYGYELTPKEQKDFDYYDNSEDFNSASFFRYRGHVYDLSQFMRVEGNMALLGWDGYSSDTYFSGVLVKYTDDPDSVIVGMYYS